MAQIDITEVRRGLVVFLSPKVLSRHGAYSTAGRDRVRDDHYFLCVVPPDANGISTWLPCTTKSGPRRVWVPPEFRTGHLRWRQRPCFVSVRELWTMDGPSVEAASYGDESIFSARPRINLDFLTENIHRLEIAA